MSIFNLPGRKLFLDDERKPPTSAWDVVRNYDAFVRYVEAHGTPKIVSFDHDLAMEHYPNGDPMGWDVTGVVPYDTYKEKTGYHAAKWLLERGAGLPDVVVVHTLNPVGAQNIIKTLQRHCLVVHFPFGSKAPLRIYKPE